MTLSSTPVDRHVAQWLHNRALIPQLPPVHRDWIVTVVFYTAVHAIDAVLATEGVSVWNHDTRFIALGNVNKLAKVRGPYHSLYNLSRTVRYTADVAQWVPAADIDRQVVRRYLLPLEQSVQRLLGRELPLTPLDLSHLTASAAA